MTSRTAGAAGYRVGGYYERRAAAVLESEGYLVWQSRGSKGAADLIAIKPAGRILGGLIGGVCEVLLVQVKGRSAAITSDGWNLLYALAAEYGALPIVADFPARGELRLRKIIAPHEARRHHWPAVPFHTDRVGGP